MTAKTFLFDTQLFLEQSYKGLLLSNEKHAINTHTNKINSDSGVSEGMPN